jgi:hypothetical protein
MSRRASVLPIIGLALAGVTAAAAVQAQFPDRGDDVTPSLGQFNVVVDAHFELAVKSNPAYAPYLSNKGGHLNFTSPIMFDPATTIGRSDPLSAGSPADTAGVLAGILAPRLIRDDQFTVRPSFAEGPDGTREVHTYIESIHLTGSGFEVKAGRQAPLRPISAGEVESLSGNSDEPAQDFPANSFFDVFVQVDVPSLGGFPKIELVNVDPLLVQSTSITAFPPTVLYIHGNSSAVPLYFNTDLLPIGVHRGDLFGQLTLAGHGVGFTEADVPEFEAAEAEAETHNGRLPLQDNPIQHVDIVDEFSCVGDCDGSGVVTVDEILTLVNVAIGNGGTCPGGLPGGVTPDVPLILQAVNHALTECGG